jgi:PKHD-type hydroxylase
VSIVIGLNDPDEYEGGGTEIFFGSQSNPTIKLPAGEAILFPSYVMHRAVAITRGLRWTLVVWFCGNRPFR